MRILGLDIGEKRIGVAVSDKLGISAQGVGVIRRKDLAFDIGEIERTAVRFAVSEIIVGVPLRFDGSASKMAETIKAFASELEKRVAIPVKLWDERFSTVSAERTLLEADTSRTRRKKVIDKLASQIILQHYLDSEKR